VAHQVPVAQRHSATPGDTWFKAARYDTLCDLNLRRWACGISQAQLRFLAAITTSLAQRAEPN